MVISLAFLFLLFIKNGDWLTPIETKKAWFRPIQIIFRFHPTERLRKFGKEGTKEYEKRVKAHRNEIISKLVAVTNRYQ